MKTKHIPGSWLLVGRSVFASEYKGRDQPAICRMTYGVDGINESNARFIVAAPEMVKALEAMDECTVVSSADEEYEIPCPECVGLMHDALDKARGYSD